MTFLKRHLLFLLITFYPVTSIAGGPPPPMLPGALEDECEISSDLENDLLLGDNSFDDDEECSLLAQGNVVKEGETLRSSTTTFTNALSGIAQGGLGNNRGQNIALIQKGFPASGLSAGDAWENYSFWLSYSRVETEDDLSSTAYDSSTNNAMAGIDYIVSDRMVVGLAFLAEDNDVDTVFNTGSQKIDGFMVAPYFGYSLTDVFSIDGSVGYGGYDIDQVRTDPVTGTLVDGDTESDRWFASFNLNAFRNVGNWFLSGRAGMVYSEEDHDGYTETGVAGAAVNPAVASQELEFGQLQIGGEAAYSLGNFEPFVSAFYEYDFEREKIIVNAGQARPDNDRDDVRLGLGVRAFSNDGFAGILQWNTVLDRSNFDSHEISLFGRLEF